MTRFESVIHEFSKEVIRRAQLELGTKKVREYTTTKVKANRVATGTLKKSLSYELTTRDKKGRFVDRRLKFFVLPPADEYAYDVHEGVPPGRDWRRLLVPIAKWIRIKPVKLRGLSGEFIRMDDIEVARAARRFAKAIESRGIGGEPFFQLAINRALPRYRDKLTQALKEDIEIELKDLWQ